MPRKNKNLSKLLKKHRKGVRKSTTIPKFTKKPKVLRLTQLRKKLEEDKEIKNFFEQAIEIKDNDKLLFFTKKFSETSKDAYYRHLRRNFFFGTSGVAKLLPPNEYRNFIIEYLNQPTERTVRSKGKDGKIIAATYRVTPKSLDVFWNSYIEQPRIRKIIESHSRKRAEAKKVTKRLAEHEEEIHEEIHEVIDYKEIHDKEITPLPSPSPSPSPPPSPKKPRTTIMVEIITDKDGKPVLDKDGKPSLRKVNPTIRKRPIRQSNTFSSKCISEQRSAPWLEEKVIGCFILPIGDNELVRKYSNHIGNNFIKTFLKSGPYANKDKPRKLYKAKLSFYQLLCGIQASRNEQEKEVLHARTPNGQVISFYVAYQIVKNSKTSVILQNEEIASKKDTWYTRAREGRKERMERLLKGPVTSLLTSIGINRIANGLREAASGSLDGFEHHEEFAKTASQVIESRSNTALEYIKQLSNTMAYLEAPGAVVFRHRVNEGWYNARTFVSLTPQQMLPHGMDGKLAQINANIILARQKRLIDSLSNMYYQLEYSTERIPTMASGVYWFEDVKVGEWRLKCENRDQIINIPDYRLITYEEGEKIYCLDINDLKSQIQTSLLFNENIEEIISNKELINPYTKVPLNEEFVTNLVRTFDNIDWEEEEEGEDQKEGHRDEDDEDLVSPPSPDEMLAPGLIDMIINNIALCKEELDSEHLNKDGKCPAMDVDDGEDEDDGEDVEEDEDDEEDENVDVEEDDDEDVDVEGCRRG